MGKFGLRNKIEVVFVTAVALAFMLGLGGCAGESKKVKEETNQKVAEQPVLNKPGQILDMVHTRFTDAPGLTDAQKIKLKEVLTKTFTDAEKIKTEFTKTKGALIEALISPEATRDEVQVFKKRLIALDRQRLDVMLLALDETEKIVGKNKETAEYFHRMFERSSEGKDLP